MGATDWMLVPSTPSAMEMNPQRLQEVRKVEGINLPKDFITNKINIIIPANTLVKILLDQTF